MRPWQLLVAAAAAAVGSAGWLGCVGDEFTTTTETSGTGGAGGNGGAGGGGGDACEDADGDGTTTCEGDCNDADAAVHPGAAEICGDEVDNDCDGVADPGDACQGIGTYVSALIGDDSNPGTKKAPVKTIAEGMNKAAQLGATQPVFVAEGTYPEDVTLQEGIDLLGGHRCAEADNCTWKRDPAMYVSMIKNQDLDGIRADPGITRETLVEGFTVKGLGASGGTSQSSAFLLHGTPEIRGNRILAGDVTGCASLCGSRGVTVSGTPAGPAGALIAGNVILGGASQATTVGVEVKIGGVAEIADNDIEGGTGGWTRCVSVVAGAGAVSISRNALHAGGCGGNGGGTFALHVGQGVNATIDSNRINADPARAGSCLNFGGAWWTGGIESDGSSAVITNNIVVGVASPRSTAVLLADCEGDCLIGQVALNSNTLDGGGVPASGNPTVSAAVVFKTWKAARNIEIGRVRNNILLGGKGEQRYGGHEDVGVAGSTCTPKVFTYNDLFDTTPLYSQWNGTAAVNHTTILAVNGLVNGAGDNISADPKLDPTFHLFPGSPCIDAGTSAGSDTPEWDIDGDRRPMGPRVDIGADEAG